MSLSFSRRALLLGAAAASIASHARSAAGGELRVGYQKNGVLVVARRQGSLEQALAPLGFSVKWVEFTSGPPMMEAMNAGAVDFGQVGDSPPIFAQAGNANIVYVAGQPITNGQGILVRKDSPIRSVAELKGLRIGFGKGTSAHNVVLLALASAKLSYGDIQPVYLNPPDAASAFARGTIDAWAVWDPYFSIGELKGGGRVLAQAIELGKTNSFYVANAGYARFNGRVLRAAIDSLAETALWAEAHRDLVGKALAEVTGVDIEIQTFAAARSSFAIGRLTDDIVATQQQVADRFHALGLIPRPIAVRDAVWNPPNS
jgi:sulfonate transport system substrate-binding protein